MELEKIYEEIVNPTRAEWQQGFMTRAISHLSSFGLVMEFSGAFVRGQWDGEKFVNHPQGKYYKAAILATIDASPHH